MLVRWTFSFGENHLAVEVRDEAEDSRISDAISGIENDELFLYAPGLGRDAYVNLRQVKVILREEINESSEIPSVTVTPEVQISSDQAV